MIDSKISQLPPIAAPLVKSDLFVAVQGGVTSRATGRQVDALLKGWTIRTAAYTATAFDRVLADTSASAFTVTLPALPGAGDQIEIADGGGAFRTNNLTVGRNGQTIMGLTEDMIVSTSGVHFTMIFDGVTWRVA